MKLAIPRLPKLSLPAFKLSKKDNLYLYAGIALAVILAAWAIWYKNRKSIGLEPFPGGKKEEQPSTRLKYVYPFVYKKETELTAFKPEKFPAFQLNKGEFFVWDSLVLNRIMAGNLLERGVTQINIKKAKEVNFDTPSGKRFLILYRNFFALPIGYATLAENKRRLTAEINSHNPGGIEVLNLDLENDEHSDEYANACREMATFCRAELGVKYVDFLGMTVIESDFNMVGMPLTDSYFGRHFRGVVNYDDPYPYLQANWFDSGDWLYAAAYLTERARATDPDLAQVSFWWKRDFTGQVYVPDHIAHAVPLFILLTGGKGLMNWDEGGRDQYFSADEALMAGFHRASLVNDIRQGKPTFLVPQISFDGGKTWHENDGMYAKKNRHPIVRVVKNGGSYVVVGHNPILNAQPLDVTLKVDGLQDTIRLRDKETYLGRM